LGKQLNQQIDMGDFEKGIYFMEIYTKDKQYYGFEKVLKIE